LYVDEVGTWHKSFGIDIRKYVKYTYTVRGDMMRMRQQKAM